MKKLARCRSFWRSCEPAVQIVSMYLNWTLSIFGTKNTGLKVNKSVPVDTPHADVNCMVLHAYPTAIDKVISQLDAVWGSVVQVG
jgi:hypothetical protein